jgi:diadenosine tetraphosphate (Ap4A) HIT family hydrolase
MKDCNCGYCVGGEPLAKFGIKICDLEASQLVLFKEQSHPGRVIVAYKDHISEPVDISPEDRAAYFEDVARVAKAIHKAFRPDKINYGAYGDGGSHLHFHLVPKYKDQFEWGTPFAMNPGRVTLSDEEYEEVIRKIKDAL